MRFFLALVRSLRPFRLSLLHVEFPAYGAVDVTSCDASDTRPRPVLAVPASATALTTSREETP